MRAYSCVPLPHGPYEVEIEGHEIEGWMDPKCVVVLFSFKYAFTQAHMHTHTHRSQPLLFTSIL